MTGELFPTTLEGTVVREIYRNAEGTFAVLSLEGEDGVATVAGPLPPATKGERVHAEGEWVDDPRFGRQFKARRAWLQAPETPDALLTYLGSGAVSGVGPSLAERIVERFGEGTVGILDEEPERLLEVRGIGPAKLERIRESWTEQRASRDVMLYLRGHGVGPVLAQRIYTRFGARTREVIDADPYLLAREIEGAGFLTADRLAQALGFALDDPRRLRAGLLHVAQEALSQGSTAIPADALLERAAQALGSDPQAMEPALQAAREDGALELDRPDGSLDLIYLPRILRAERGAARLTVQLASTPGARGERDVDLALSTVTLGSGGDLHPNQLAALSAALTSALTVVTGGPGVGKTTVVRALVEILTRDRTTFALAAPTGRAAKRLEEATGTPAATIHRLLEWDPRGGGFGRNAKDPLQVDLLVVDEASMMDLQLYHAVTRALRAGASLCLIGDVDQLPSVGPGTVLADLIACGAARVVHLTEVFRQAAESRIVTTAHAINAGLLPDLSRERSSDFFFAHTPDPEAAQRMIVRLVTERIPARFDLDPVRDVQVLAPMHRGVCGTTELNRVLKAALVPGAGDPEPHRLDPGDKVMQLKNDYQHEVFNGDVGRVVGDGGGGGVVVEFDGRQVLYTRAERRNLTLAYCATIHKAQGSEYPAVVIPVLTEHFVMLQRNLLYTAITRGRKLAVLVGQRRALELAVQNDRPNRRLSFLGERVRRALSSPCPG